MKNVYLVGFMGTGKTVVGKALAKRLGIEFVDLDDLIEAQEGMKITDIFSKKGEEYFRNKENEALEEVSKKDGYVVACGGGVVLKEENIKRMEEAGFIICYDATVDVVYERTRKFVHRPLLNVEDPRGAIRDLMQKRKPYYDKIPAVYHIDTSGLSVKAQTDKTLKKIKDLEK